MRRAASGSPACSRSISSTNELLSALMATPSAGLGCQPIIPGRRPGGKGRLRPAAPPPGVQTDTPHSRSRSAAGARPLRVDGAATPRPRRRRTPHSRCLHRARCAAACQAAAARARSPPATPAANRPTSEAVSWMCPSVPKKSTQQAPHVWQSNITPPVSRPLRRRRPGYNRFPIAERAVLSVRPRTGRRPSMSPRPFFRHHLADAVLAVSGVAQVAFLLFTFLAFPILPWWLVGVSFLTYSVLICWNLQCVSHNFIHNPFFTSRWLNRAVQRAGDAGPRRAARLYHHYHMNHHFGDNDTGGPRRHHARLVVDLPPRHDDGARAVLALRPAQLLPRRGRPGAARRAAARPGGGGPGRRREPRPGRLLGADGRWSTGAFFAVLLPAVVLPRLGAELRRGLPRTLRLPARATRTPTRSAPTTGCTTCCGSTTATTRSTTGTRSATGRG